MHWMQVMSNYLNKVQITFYYLSSIAVTKHAEQSEKAEARAAFLLEIATWSGRVFIGMQYTS
jgi:hypothetical protein